MSSEHAFSSTKTMLSESEHYLMDESLGLWLRLMLLDIVQNSGLPHPLDKYNFCKKSNNMKAEEIVHTWFVTKTMTFL